MNSKKVDNLLGMNTMGLTKDHQKKKNNSSYYCSKNIL